MSNKIYIVMGSDAPMYGDESWVCEVFFDKEKAEKYAEIQNKLEGEMYSYYVIDKEPKEDFDLNTTVKPYYSYYIGKEEPSEFEELDYWEVKDYLLTNGLLSEEELTSVEEKDKTLNNVGNRAYREVFSYIKEHLPAIEIEKLVQIFNMPDNRYMNDAETEKRIYTTDLHIEETEDYINAYSVNSYEEARQEALKLYDDWKNK